MSQSPLTYQSLLDQQPSRRTVIIGAGIVGSAVASYLSFRTSDQIVVLDRSLSTLSGSTGPAPGFVGQLNESIVLTTLAKESVKAYRGIPGGFSDCGGLEVAQTEQGMETLRSRLSLALQNNLPATLLNAEETVHLAPDFVRPDQLVGGLHFHSDGAADARRVTSTFRSDAESRGVVFLEAEATQVALSDLGGISSVGTSLGAPLSCSSLVLATGIWTSHLIQNLGLELPTPIPVIPVAHPYAHSRPHALRLKVQPFIRWAESQVYARDHGPFDGIGSYNHVPMPISDAGPTAIGPDWPDIFSAAIAKAAAHLPDPSPFSNHDPKLRPTTAGSVINGIFAVTPDNLPLVGPIQAIPGLYLAAGIWVTHAAGCARLLVDMMLGDLENPSHKDQEIVLALNPERFGGVEADVLKERALDNYNHIYRSGEVAES